MFGIFSDLGYQPANHASGEQRIPHGTSDITRPLLSIDRFDVNGRWAVTVAGAYVAPQDAVVD